MKKINSIRGVHDVLPDDMALWKSVENTVITVLENYTYREIRLPIIESTSLFKRSIGEATDIVEKEMYSFKDLNDEWVTLRPEGTASCVRAGIQHGLLYNQRARLFYHGPMFRREKPQRGRYRQFYQIGAEAFGFPGPEIDIELIALSARIFSKLDLSLSLEINSIGNQQSRAAYRKALVDYLSVHEQALDADSQRRLQSNPLRILDSKSRSTQEILAGAPDFAAYLDEESQAHFSAVCSGLKTLGIEYALNSRLVRGLDYYSHTVFEWKTDQLGAQGAVCSGGRYDDLVAQLGGSKTAAVGWALGLERCVDLVSQQQSLQPTRSVDVCILTTDATLAHDALAIAERLRDQCSWVIELDVGEGKLKSKLKRADRSGAVLALILGQQEKENDEVLVKPLLSEETQYAVPVAELKTTLDKLLALE